jgi:hypothetical protein
MNTDMSFQMKTGILWWVRYVEVCETRNFRGIKWLRMRLDVENGSNTTGGRKLD